MERNQSQDIAQEVMGQSQNTTAQTSMTYEFKVTGVTPAGDIQMGVAMVVFSMTATNPMGDMKYDSATDSVAPDFAKSMVITLNEVYTMTMSPLGKITDVKAPDGLAEKVNKLIESFGGTQMAMAATSAAEAASAEGFLKTIEGMIVQFPADGVQAKEPWEITSKLQQMITFDLVTKYELISSSKDAISLKVTSQITQDPKNPPMEMQGMNITYELLGANEGTLQLDPKTNLITAGEIVTSISGNITVDSPQLPSPMSIPITVRSTDKITRK
jgi:hypothetical protein